MPTVAIVEDHQLVAQTLRASLLSKGMTAEIVIAPDARTVLDALLAARPDLVLLDLDLGPLGDATPLIKPLAAAGMRVLVVSGITDHERAALAYEQGAFGYQPKEKGFDALLDKIDAALHSGEPLDPVERESLLAELRRTRAERERSFAPFRTLTERERATLVALSEGRAVTQIARDWVVSEATVRSHVRGLLVKLDVQSQLAAVTLAVHSGWLDHDL